MRSVILEKPSENNYVGATRKAQEIYTMGDFDI